MLKLLAQSPETLEAIGPRLSDDHFERAQHRRLLQQVKASRGDLRGLVAGEDDERAVAVLAALATEQVEGTVGLDHGERVFLSLEEYRLKRRIDDVRKRLEKLNPTTEPGYEALFEELIALEGERRRVRTRADEVGSETERV